MMISYMPLVATLKKKKMDINDLQEKLGKKDGFLKSCLNERRYVSLKTIDEICKVLSCKISDVIEWKEGTQILHKVERYADCNWNKLLAELSSRGESFSSISEKMKKSKGWLQNIKNRGRIKKTTLKEICDSFFIDYNSVITA